MSAYFTRLWETSGRAWNRFWFAPQDVATICLLRILVGIVALYYVLSFSGDLVRWFGPEGLLPVNTVRELSGNRDMNFHFSLFHLPGASEPAMLWLLHGLVLLALLAFTVGWWTRVAAVASLVGVLSYVHRGPLLTGPLEPVLTMFMAYLCITPCGREFSLDAWWRQRRRETAALSQRDPRLSRMANLGLRLMQVHLAGLYLCMGLSKLAGEPWWSGEAVWLLLGRTESRLMDLSFLDGATFVINAWTHAIVAFELLYPLLIWNRLARPLVMGVSIVMWAALSLATGSLVWSLLMIVANLVFIDPLAVRARLSGQSLPARTWQPE